MAIETISCANARAKGLKRYFTGKPCSRGHLAERAVSSRICLHCLRGNTKKYRTVNAEKVAEDRVRHRASGRETTKAYNKKYRKENKERVRLLMLAWRRNNKSRMSEVAKIWRAKNPERLRTLDAAKRARMANAPGSHTTEQTEQLFEKQKRKCLCGVRLTKRHRHLDHIAALARGGSNDISNLQWLCPSCNCRKNAKDPIVWAQENGRLL